MTRVPSSSVGAVILVGGTGVRLGGVDKASLELDGLTLLERALSATAAAVEVVVVGEPTATSRPVTWTRESPALGGPAAGVLAGLDAFGSAPDLVVVLAVDMPMVTASTVARLVQAMQADETADAAALVDHARAWQTLAGVYRYDALAAARPKNPRDTGGLSMRKLVAPLRMVEVPAVADEARDVDTWDDLRELER